MRTSRADLRRALEGLGRRPVPARSQAFVDDLETRLLAYGAHQMPARALTTTRTDLRRALETVAKQPVATPSPTFVDDLERHLLGQGADALPERVAVLTPRSPRRWRLAPVVSAAAAVVAALVLVGALSGWVGGGSEHRLALAAAVDTTVQLPDGREVTGRTGLTLPDGAIVRTGPNGHASAGNVELGPGLEAIVSDGRLHLSSTSAETPTTAAPSPTAAPAAGSPPTGSSSDASPPSGASTQSPTPTQSPITVLPEVTVPPSVPESPITLPPLTLPKLPSLFGSG